MVEAGAITPLAKLLESNDDEVQIPYKLLIILIAYMVSLQLREQALWALGNIAGDGPRMRDALIELGVLQFLLQLLQCGPKVCDYLSYTLLYRQLLMLFLAIHGAHNGMGHFQSLPWQETISQLQHSQGGASHDVPFGTL